MIIKVTKNLDLFLNKMIANNLKFTILKENKDYMLVEIDYKDYKEIKRIGYFSKIKIIKYLGVIGIKNNIKKYKYDYILLIFFIFSLYIISNFIFAVDIKHESSQLRSEVKNIIKEYNIKKFTIKKNNQKLNDISNEIIKNNRDIIDWISIKRVGMKYIVNVEERIIKKEKIKHKYCHIVAEKDAVIQKIDYTNGMSQFENGSMVKKGDIIISGEIKFNDEVKGNVCASGTVLGNTWYKVVVNYPLNYIEKDYTKKKKYNIIFKDRRLFKNKFELYNTKTIFNFWGFKLVLDQEYYYKNVKYSNKQARAKAIKKAELELKNKLKKYEIVEYQILNATNASDFIELEIFYSLTEDIGKLVEYSIENSKK